MKLSDWLPSVFVEGDGDDIQVTTKKFSQFPTATGEGIQGVGIKDGNNVKFELTTDSIKVNPEPFRAKNGQFIGTPEELAGLENQRDVNNFLYGAINDIEAGDINLDGYATEDWVEDKLGELPPGTVVSDTAPADPEEGMCWYDTERLELFVFAEDAWLPCSPLGARVEQGEAVQAQIIDQIKVSLDEQASLRNKVGELDSEKATVEYVDERDEAAKKYTDDQLVDAAKKSQSNTFKGIQTFEKSTYFQNICIHNGKNTDTITEVRGDNEDGTKQLWWKIRGTNRVSWICYPGQENKDYKKCMEMEWDADAGAPLVKLDYLQPPTGNRHAATKQYVDNEVAGKLSVDEANEVTTGFRIKGDGGTYVSTANGELGLYHLKYPESEGHAATKQYVDDEIAKSGGGSFAETGSTTPSLSAGQLFYNTTDKVLYIGE